jgi:hypothetical protein
VSYNVHVTFTSGLAAGDVIVIDPRIDTGFEVYGGEDVTLYGVHVLVRR